MDLNSSLSTSEIMNQYKVTRNALRLYEEMGLLVQIERTDSGYRKFTSKNLEELNFILNAKNSGFTLNEIKDFLNITRAQKSLNCETVAVELTKKLNDIDSEILILKEKKRFLNNFLETCGSKSSETTCNIIQTGFEKKSCC